MKFRTWLSRIALGTFVLGVFFSCSPPAPETAFPQDREVGALAAEASDLDSTWLSQNRDSSGWRLRWTPPLTQTDTVGIYIFADTLTPAQFSKLSNGTQSLDLTGLPAHVILPASDTSWQIPSSFLDGRQGKALRTDRHYRFSVWIRYKSGPSGPTPYRDLFLGDDIPPQLPLVQDSVGQTMAVLKFSRPSDAVNVFDTVQRGPLKSVVVLYWPGRPVDSAGKVVAVSVPAAQVANPAVDSFRLVLSPLDYWTTYNYVLEAVDTAGNLAHSDIFQFSTLDQFPPGAPGSLISHFVRSDSVAFSWAAAADTFQDSAAARQAFPNYHIASYVLRVNGKDVDSVYLDNADSTTFGAGRDTTIGRFHWDGNLWNWYWRSLRPGKPYLVELLVYDRSGNSAATIPSSSGTAAPAFPGASCPTGWVAVEEDPATGLSRFCIEEHEHASGSRIVTRVTWAQAVQACASAGAELCSEAQWVRACEKFPADTGRADTMLTYGAIEAGSDQDTLPWLKQHCQLGTGDSAAMLDLSNSDPLCVSGWGVFDMPGRVGEWTRDVYATVRDSGATEAGTLAYLGVSDLTGDASLGTLHGGSALILDQPDRTLASARCEERNYPASSQLDTIPGTTNLRPHPYPAGMSSAWGFRCCTLLR